MSSPTIPRVPATAPQSVRRFIVSKRTHCAAKSKRLASSWSPRGIFGAIRRIRVISRSNRRAEERWTSSCSNSRSESQCLCKSTPSHLAMTVESIFPCSNHPGEAAGVDIDCVAINQSRVIERRDWSAPITSGSRGSGAIDRASSAPSQPRRTPSRGRVAQIVGAPASARGGVSL